MKYNSILTQIKNNKVAGIVEINGELMKETGEHLREIIHKLIDRGKDTKRVENGYNPDL